MDSLPPELLLLLPAHLPLASLNSLALVSRRFHFLFNPCLYRADALSPAPIAPFWAAETRSLPTLIHSLAAGANLSETRLFDKPRGAISDPYSSLQSQSQDVKIKSRTRRYSIGSSSFLDGPVGGRYKPTYWWRPVDLAAFCGWTDGVRFLVQQGGVDVRREGSKGLCEEEAGCTLRDGGFKAVIHSVEDVARCRGHGEVVRLIEEVGTKGKGSCLEGGCAGEVMMEKMGDEGAAFSFRDFVLERF